MIVPYCMGSVAGAIASGRVPSGGEAGDPWSSWLNPTSITRRAPRDRDLCISLGGLPGVGRPATRRTRSGRILPPSSNRRVGRCRGLAFAGIFVLHVDATYLYHGLTSRALPLVSSPACGIVSLVLLVRGSAPIARLFSVGAVATVVIAWGVAQWPYMLPTSLKVSTAAAPTGTLEAVLVVFAVVAVTILPALGLLYILDQKSLLPGKAPMKRSGRTLPLSPTSKERAPSTEPGATCRRRPPRGASPSPNPQRPGPGAVGAQCAILRGGAQRLVVVAPQLRSDSVGAWCQA